MWGCDDPVCDCTQPRIVHIKEPSPGQRFYRREIVEEGPFHSEATAEETKEQWTWLLNAAIHHNVANLQETMAVHAAYCR